MVDRLKVDYAGVVEFRLINVDTHPEGNELMARYGAQFVPTFVFLTRDGEVSEMIVGAQKESVLRNALDAYVRRDVALAHCLLRARERGDRIE